MKKANHSTPKIMHRAGELRTPALAGSAKEEPTPAEARLWAIYARCGKTVYIFVSSTLLINIS